MLWRTNKTQLLVNEATEKEFQKAFQFESKETFLLAMALGSFYCWLGFFLHFNASDALPITNYRQTLRVALGLVMAFPIVLNALFPSTFENYLIQSKYICLACLATLLTVFTNVGTTTLTNSGTVHRTIATVIVVAWLTYTLFKLHRAWITLALLPSWISYLHSYATLTNDNFSANKEGGTYWLAWIVLTVAIIGWFANKRIEDRERLVFIQRRELEIQLETNKALMEKTEKTNAGIRHDVRQPVWAMSLYLGALQEDYANPTKQADVKEYVTRLFQCLQSIDQTVARIAVQKPTPGAIASRSQTVVPNSSEPTKTTNKMVAKNSPPNAENPVDLSFEDETELDDLQGNLSEVDLTQVLSKLNAIFSAVAKARNVNIRFNISNAVPVISNEAILQDTLANLISNGIKFSAMVARPSWVVVHCHVSRNEVRISIADNGIGIAPDEQKKIFEPYYQIGEVGSESPEHPTSEGLGLAMVERNLAQLSDHRLKIYSDRNKGACFKVYLPRA